MSNHFRLPPRIVHGWGALDELGDLAGPLGRRALLVTGRRAMRAAGITDRALGELEAAGLEVALFEEVEPEPDVSTVDRGREAAREAGAEVVIGLGGGSAMDAAQVIAGLAGETAPTREFHGDRTVESEGLPFIAVPTTAGTGSEMTSNGVISDRERQVKKSIRGERFMARVALVDPELTVACPPEVTAASGFDALSQALESYVSIHATPVTEALSMRAALEIVQWLERAVSSPTDRAARTHMANGSMMAGMALGNARLGVIHGIVHPLGVRYGIAHGVACGVLLPEALGYNREANGSKHEAVSHLLGGDPADTVRGMLGRTGMPTDLKSYRIPESDFETIAEQSMPSGSLKANPRKVTREDVVELLQAVC